MNESLLIDIFIETLFYLEFAIIDIETTGGNKDFAKITEVAIVVSDGKKIIDEYETLINPGIPIPYNITRITGIDDAMVKHAPKFYEVAKKIIELTENRVFVAHNVNFDYGFIKKEFKDLGYAFNREKICTVKTARKSFPGYASYSLGKICADLNIPLKSRHRAMGDCEATVILFHRILENNNFIIDGLKFDNYLKDQLKVSSLKNKPGIYFFKNNEGKNIYIGKSITIKSRVQTHLNNYMSKKGMSIIEQISKIDCFYTGNEIMALLFENKEIKKHKPIYNRAQKNTIFPFGLFINTDCEYNKIEVKKIGKDDEIIIGFKSKKLADNFLRKITEKYMLCEKINGLENISGKGACFANRIEKCNGACIQKESKEVYNTRLALFKEDYGVNNEDCFFISDGRSKKESSYVLLKKGIISGFGYIKKGVKYNADQLLLLSEDFTPDKDFQRVVKQLYLDRSFIKYNL